MRPSSVGTCLFSFLFTILVPFTFGFDRKITSQLNPGCDSCNGSLVYLRAEGPDDTIHQIWDFTHGTPTIIFVKASPYSTMTIEWKDSSPVVFNMSEEPKYSFGLAALAIFEYDDLKDEAHFDKSLPYRIYPFDRFPWKLNKSSLGGNSEAMVQLRSSYVKKGVEKNCVDFKLLMLPYKDYGAQLPHLIHTANTTLIDIDLVNLTTYNKYNSSRFALQFLMVSTDDAYGTNRIRQRKSLDDEHTPGVFEIIEIKTPESDKSGSGGFVQFRPVAYTKSVRGVDTSTVVRTGDLFNKTVIPRYGTLQTFYKTFDPRRLLIQDFFVNFGDSGDGFYKHTNYTSWSFTLGYGAPPLEGFSLFVIMIISIGLGVPVLLALSGITFVLVKRCRPHNPPTRLTEEE